MFAKRVLLSLVILLSGCAGPKGGWAEWTAEKQAEYKAINTQTHLALGEKTVAGPPDTIMRGVIAAVGDLNMNVSNVNTEIGFMSATGTGILPGDIEREAARSMLAENERETGAKWHYIPANYQIGMNVSIYDYDPAEDETKVKIRISQTNVDSPYLNINSEMPPDLLVEHYKYIWEVIGRYVFIESETQ